MPSDSNQVTMLLTGDNMLVEHPNPDTAFDLILPTLRRADVLFGNLEAPATDKGQPVEGRPMAGGVHRMRPETLNVFARTGFNVVSLANNVSMGYGGIGLMDTIEGLKRLQILSAGGGKNVTEAHRPAIIERKGVRIAFLAYSTVFWPSYPATADRPGIAVVRVDTAYQPNRRLHEQPGGPATTLTFPQQADVDELAKDIAAAKSAADLVVVAWHWGISELHRKMTPYQFQLGHACVDFGADLVVGSHSHCLQPIEVYKGKVIAYSLGNFMAYMPHKAHWWVMDPATVVLECTIANKKIARVSYIPVMVSEQWQPAVVKGRDADLVHTRIRDAQTELPASTLNPTGDEVVIFDRSMT